MGNKVATSSMDENPKEKSVQIVQLGSQQRSIEQIETLLNIIEASGKMLANVMEIGETYELNKEAEKAAESTFTLAHIRLRDCIEDQSRWDARDPSADRRTDELVRAQINIAELQARNAAERGRPCYIYGASLQQFEVEGRGKAWVAFLGPVPAVDGLVGVGPSPEAAFAAFDRAFTTAIDAAPPPPDKAPDKPKKKKR